MFTVVIPARYRSERLPGKPLLEIAGKPMVQHVYERARESRASDVVVATDDVRIADAVEAFGGRALMTSPNHPSGTDRLHEAARLLGLNDEDLVVNVQGDEPLIPPEVINQVASNLEKSGAPMATLYERIREWADVINPNVVKVVTRADNIAAYFSRAPIPFDRAGTASTNAIDYKRHLGIYAYRVSMLSTFVSLPPCSLETTERLEQLRALWHGYAIHVDEANVSIPPGVDTEQDLVRTRAILESRS